jgi:hypothetical protein
MSSQIAHDDHRIVVGRENQFRSFEHNFFRNGIPRIHGRHDAEVVQLDILIVDEIQTISRMNVEPEK